MLNTIEFLDFGEIFRLGERATTGLHFRNSTNVTDTDLRIK